LSQQFHPKTRILIAQDHAFPDNPVENQPIFHHIALTADPVIDDNQAFIATLGVNMASQL
jgi:hypothetical protein